jgi:hypothetical protein
MTKTPYGGDFQNDRTGAGVVVSSVCVLVIIIGGVILFVRGKNTVYCFSNCFFKISVNGIKLFHEDPNGQLRQRRQGLALCELLSTFRLMNQD